MSAVAMPADIPPQVLHECAAARGGRPAGEVRKVLVAALEQGKPMSLRDLAHRCKVGVNAARRTLDHLVRAGVVEIVGHEKRAHCRKWVALYDLVRRNELASISPAAQLSAALAGWCR
jgi:predicted ArsR family transcriptional regulator